MGKNILIVVDMQMILLPVRWGRLKRKRLYLKWQLRLPSLMAMFSIPWIRMMKRI